MKRTLVAIWDAKLPRGSKLRKLRPEFKDPQLWSVRISVTRADGTKDDHSYRAKEPCTLATMKDLVMESIGEVCEGTPMVKSARMEFFA